MPVIPVTDANFEEVVASSSLPLVLAIGAPWCPDCQRLQPFFMRFAEEYAGKVAFAHADYDNCKAIVEKFEVQHIPTICAIKSGEVVARLVEPKSVAPFKELVQKALEA